MPRASCAVVCCVAALLACAGTPPRERIAAADLVPQPLAAPKGATPAFQGSVIGVSRSADGGATWSDQTLVVDRPAGGDPAEIDDKEWLSVDPESGTLTIAWVYALVSGNASVGFPTIYV